MRIMIDVARVGRGGLERQVVQLASGLSRRGHACVLTVHKDVVAYADELDRGDVVVESLGRMGRYDPRVALDLMRVCRTFKPDVVLSVEFVATLWGRLAAVAGGRPCVTAEHSTMFRQRRRVILTNRILGPATRAIVACAEAQVPTLVAAGNPGRSIVVVANGVDTAEFYPAAAEGLRFRRDAGIPGDAVVVALVAAHRREKRHDRFLRLIECLDAAGHHVWGLMAGGGPLLDADRELARRSPCAGRLVVAGPVSDMRAVYGASDVVTLTSDDVETFPLSFLEAQACGTPVVGMDTGGVRETLVPGETGIIVGQGDEVAMAGAVAGLVADADRRALMGAAARDWVESSLSLELMVSRYERVLERVAAGWRAGR